jgi:hypothetical protein
VDLTKKLSNSRMIWHVANQFSDNNALPIQQPMAVKLYVRRGKSRNYVLRVTNLLARNADEVGWRLWWGLAETASDGSVQSGGRLCVGVNGSILN